jgi:hypothetical protein
MKYPLEVAMLTAVLPVVGVLVGASLQYFFTRYLETQRHHRDLRTQAYLDYIKSVSGLAHLNDPQGSQERDLLASAADAKARICLYGSGEVVKAFALFEKLGAAVTSPSQRESFVAMIVAMRSDSGSASRARIEDVRLLLLGSSG